ncbi:hypothetical protein DFH08DRAFT_155998 [Mycena albidolilacea]|uniref:Uncharacterized protein n=1 Tax=Mycena albidolilacea TaxID=1033008 RepID=A0AAD7A241_9AGAR|nr:hypothetical protein DFH08DRAFT_155998 [Mycena albidolilacea]
MLRSRARPFFRGPLSLGPELPRPRAAPSSGTALMAMNEERLAHRSSPPSIYRRDFRPVCPLFARLRGRAGRAPEDSQRARARGREPLVCDVLPCPVRARVASVRHYTLVVPIRLRGVAAGDEERERNANLLSWDAEGSYSTSSVLALTLSSLSHLSSVPFRAGRPHQDCLSTSSRPFPPYPRLWTSPPRVLVHTISAFDPIPQIMQLCAPKTNAHSMCPYLGPEVPRPREAPVLTTT